jgi:hypothetical protein
MDAAAHERGRAALHGLVMRRRALTALLLACVATALVAGISGGLLRAGVVPADVPFWLGRAAVAHAALMICGFMGTVIGIERAVAARHEAAWAAPLASGAGGVALLIGAHGLAGVLLCAAGAAFIAVNALLLRRQRAPHTALLMVSAIAWFTGNALFALGVAPHAVLPWWFAFLVITVAAERLEMTRLTRRRPGSQGTLYATLAALCAGAAVSSLAPAAGGVLFGAALLALSVWLFVFDIARRTVRSPGLPRYMAVCLLAGYAWLAVGGIAWATTAWGAPAWGTPARDAALHALGLGFLFSMIMGHAPVILPAVARVKLVFGAWFYLPLAALHASLLLRLGAGAIDTAWRAQGALLNVAAIALFALTAAGAAFAWRRRHGGRQHPTRTP